MRSRSSILVLSIIAAVAVTVGVTWPKDDSAATATNAKIESDTWCEAADSLAAAGALTTAVTIYQRVGLGCTATSPDGTPLEERIGLLAVRQRMAHARVATADATTATQSSPSVALQRFTDALRVDRSNTDARNGLAALAEPPPADATPPSTSTTELAEPPAVPATIDPAAWCPVAQAAVDEFHLPDLALSLFQRAASGCPDREIAIDAIGMQQGNGLRLAGLARDQEAAGEITKALELNAEALTVNGQQADAAARIEALAVAGTPVSAPENPFLGAIELYNNGFHDEARKKAAEILTTEDGGEALLALSEEDQRHLKSTPTFFENLGDGLESVTSTVAATITDWRVWGVLVLLAIYGSFVLAGRRARSATSKPVQMLGWQRSRFTPVLMFEKTNPDGNDALTAQLRATVSQLTDGSGNDSLVISTPAQAAFDTVPDLSELDSRLKWVTTLRSLLTRADKVHVITTYAEGDQSTNPTLTVELWTKHWRGWREAPYLQPRSETFTTSSGSGVLVAQAAAWTIAELRRIRPNNGPTLTAADSELHTLMTDARHYAAFVGGVRAVEEGHLVEARQLFTVPVSDSDVATTVVQLNLGFAEVSSANPDVNALGIARLEALVEDDLIPPTNLASA